MHVPPPLIAAAGLGVQYLCYRVFPALNLSFPFQQATGILLAILGVVIPLWAAVEFRRAGTTILPYKMDETSALVVSGPFRFSRNPMYLGMALVIAGCGLWTGTLSTLIVLPVFVWIINRWQIMPEEQAMARIFGTAFTDYKKSTRRWI